MVSSQFQALKAGDFMMYGVKSVSAENYRLVTLSWALAEIESPDRGELNIGSLYSRVRLESAAE